MGGGITRIHLKRIIYAFFLFFPFSALFPLVSPAAASLIPNGVYTVQPPESPVQTILEGKNWRFRVEFAVKNVKDIEKLISCESHGVNISRPDSDGTISDGILQFHRSSKNAPVGSGTWAWMESLSGIKGIPTDPAAAIKMTDWAISKNLGPHWTCWRIEKLK
jgi:hypothetical protein